MDLFEAIGSRQSVRRFRPDAVPDAAVTRLLEAAIRAPSAGNRQPWEFYVVREPATKKSLAKAASQGFVARAPVVLAVCALPGVSASKYGQRGTELYCLQDTAAAIENILLAATALGLGACWVGAFDEEGVAKALNLEGDRRPVALIPVGWPDLRPGPTPRKDLGEVVRWM